MTYDKERIERLIENFRDVIENRAVAKVNYEYFDLKIKLMLLECANEIAGKQK